LEFHITFDKAVSKDRFTGRVYVLLSQQPITELLTEPDWFDPEPFFGRDVKDWAPGTPLVLGADALGFPAPLARLPKGTYYAQAVMDFDRGEWSFAASEGNGYSKPVRALLDPARGGAVNLSIDQVYRARQFRETETVKLVDVVTGDDTPTVLTGGVASTVQVTVSEPAPVLPAGSFAAEPPTVRA